MTTKLLLGPLLGLESDTLYTVCFSTPRSASRASVTFNGKAVEAIKTGETPSSAVWRAEWQATLQKNPQLVRYHIHVDGAQAQSQDQRDWCFYIPGEQEKPRLLYASCNGFSSADLISKVEKPYILWGKIRKFQLAEMDKVLAGEEAAPYALMIMGGDQVYADEVWSKVPFLVSWNTERQEKKLKAKATKALQEQLDQFYDKLYQSQLNRPDVALTLASIPTVMMWDDHDIFDGWGSFPDKLQQCEVFQTIFAAAKRYFELFQIRSRRNQALLDPQRQHYSFALQFRGYHLLALDNRSERTRLQVMSPRQWEQVLDHLDNRVTSGDLLVCTAVPVVYRDFSFTENFFDFTPWEEELADDLKDHWRAKEHQGERARLIMRLLDNIRVREKQGPCRTVLLSGDVHVGCLGVISDRREPGRIRRIHQVVSSGIVHPAPSSLQWHGILAVTNDDTEYLNEDKTIEIRMLQPYSASRYLRVRNYVSLLEGTDRKLWLNWVCDHDIKPVYPLD